MEDCTVGGDGINESQERVLLWSLSLPCSLYHGSVVIDSPAPLLPPRGRSCSTRCSTRKRAHPPPPPPPPPPPGTTPTPHLPPPDPPPVVIVPPPHLTTLPFDPQRQL